MSYGEFLRDACNQELTPSTRLTCAWHAVYSGCVRLHVASGSPLFAADTLDDIVLGIVDRALAQLELSTEDAALVRKLCNWALFEAPLASLPMLSDEAIALSERVHKARSSDDA